MRFIIGFILYFILNSSYSQNINIYNPSADANSAINKGIAKAKAEKKFVFIQIGGNWCPWCIRFHDLYTNEQQIKMLMDHNFVPVLVNYSKENRNDAVLENLDFPQRFGFPVFVILNTEGKRIHTQNSAYLEEGKGYSKQKVMDFLKGWSPDALNPENYRNTSSGGNGSKAN